MLDSPVKVIPASVVKALVSLGPERGWRVIEVMPEPTHTIFLAAAEALGWENPQPNKVK